MFSIELINVLLCVGWNDRNKSTIVSLSLKKGIFLWFMTFQIHCIERFDSTIFHHHHHHHHSGTDTIKHNTNRQNTYHIRGVALSSNMSNGFHILDVSAIYKCEWNLFPIVLPAMREQQKWWHYGKFHGIQNELLNKKRIIRALKILRLRQWQHTIIITKWFLLIFA